MAFAKAKRRLTHGAALVSKCRHPCRFDPMTMSNSVEDAAGIATSSAKGCKTLKALQARSRLLLCSKAYCPVLPYIRLICADAPVVHITVRRRLALWRPLEMTMQ